jgi:hypothetical protein
MRDDLKMDESDAHFQELMDSRLRGPDPTLTGRLLVMISSAIAVGILVLIGVLLFVALTSDETKPPSPAEIGALAAPGNDRALEAYKEVRAQRFGVIKDLLQLLVVALVVPLLTIVLGYIFGRQKVPRTKRSRAP